MLLKSLVNILNFFKSFFIIFIVNLISGEHEIILYSSINYDGSIDYSVCGVVIKSKDYEDVVCGCENSE